MPEQEAKTELRLLQIPLAARQRLTQGTVDKRLPKGRTAR